MPMFTVCIVESRDLHFEVEADSEEEAADIAMGLELGDPENTMDQFRERIVDWAVPV